MLELLQILYCILHTIIEDSVRYNLREDLFHASIV